MSLDPLSDPVASPETQSRGGPTLMTRKSAGKRVDLRGSVSLFRAFRHSYFDTPDRLRNEAQISRPPFVSPSCPLRRPFGRPHGVARHTSAPNPITASESRRRLGDDGRGGAGRRRAEIRDSCPQGRAAPSCIMDLGAQRTDAVRGHQRRQGVRQRESTPPSRWTLIGCSGRPGLTGSYRIRAGELLVVVLVAQRQGQVGPTAITRYLRVHREARKPEVIGLRSPCSGTGTAAGRGKPWQGAAEPAPLTALPRPSPGPALRNWLWAR